MSDHSKVDPVISGVPYVVTMVNDARPLGLADFVTRDVAAVTVESHGQVVQIHGSARLDRDVVVVHEKIDGGRGQDVRTWSIRIQEGQFEAAQPWI